MQVVRLPGAFPAALRGGVIAIGNFDGMHRGHRAVLELARSHARQLQAPLLALTFEPHPREFFQPHLKPWPIFPLAERLRLLKEAGVDGVILHRFDADFAATSAEDFAVRGLAETMSAQLVVTGAGFIFGRNRQGSAAHLRQWLARQEVGYDTCAAALADGAPISSTRIRAALAEGDMELVARLLGRPYRTHAAVQHGKKLGRALGFPTANLAFTPRHAPKHGIYAAWGRIGPEAWWPAILSFGTRPTVDDGPLLLETHRLDAPEKYSIYDTRLEVAWGPFLRAEERFDGMPALVAQMDRDVAAARTWLAPRPTPDDWLSTFPTETIP